MDYLLNGAQTERLTFRLLQPADAEEWIKLFDGTDIAHFLALGHLATAEERNKAWFDAALARYKDGKGGMNVLVDKAIGNMVGQCGLLLKDIDGEDVLEIGYSILPAYWGRGYASEAAKKCMDYAFEHSNWNAVISIIHVENEASKKVARNNGMAIWKQIIYRDMPVEVFRISRNDWEKKKHLQRI